MAEGEQLEELATSLAHMARDLLAHDSVGSTLDGIVGHAVGKVDGCEVASILVLDRRKQIRTLASTSEVGAESDRIQTELGEGPCFDAAKLDAEILRIEDMTGSVDRWPNYAPRARELGIGSMIGFTLFTSRESLGALNIYSSQRNAFTEASEHAGWIFASHAAVAFASARHDAQMREAIDTREGIGQAMGIIMNRYEVSADQAFDVLKRFSQDRNVKLRDFAREVAQAGEVPGGGR